ncbi:MAG: hypothetical protein RL095_2156 [Verrucomicrobiota bacterium]|jgi:DNA-binding MarR family transcriptional regulator
MLEQVHQPALVQFEGMTLGMLRTLLTIREMPGRTIVELAEELQVDAKTAQFYCRALRRPWRRVSLVPRPLRPDQFKPLTPVLRRTPQRDPDQALIRCERSLLDQRRYEVRLTPAGLAFLQSLKESIHEH